MQLPQDVRDLEQPPFEVDWNPVAAIFQLDPLVKADPLKDTLKRKELARTLAMYELALRTDPATPLGTEARAAMDNHTAAGSAVETFT